jgi:hypothetical protein
MAITEPTPHPFWVAPTREQCLAQAESIDPETGEKYGIDRVLRDLEQREYQLEMARKEPYSCGVGIRPCAPNSELEHWVRAEKLLENHDRLAVSGGNRSGKTAFASKYLVRTMVEKPGARVVAFSMTSQSSIRDQQPAVFNMLPSQWRKPKKTKTTNVSYTVKNGFSEATFILPNGSQCWFNHYSQQPDILEGMEADLIWFDELVPYSWVETAQFRLVTRKGKMLITATPITGWTNTLAAFQSGCRFTAFREALMLEPDKVHVPGVLAGHMPYVAKCLRDDSAMVWFHTDQNPFQPQDSMQKALEKESSVQKKVRFYGWCEKTSGNYFPKFSKVHVVEPEDIPAEGTNYMVTDPAGSRMWATLWLRVDESGRMYVYREFPNRRDYGEWALPGDKPGGVKGPAQEGQGWGPESYVEEFRRLEGDEDIYWRLIDPRAGGSPAAIRDGASLVDVLRDDCDMDFEQASGVHIEQGIALINEVLDYDTEQSLSVVNEPNLYISSECGNLIDCMKEATPAGGEKNAYKDMIDCMRYLMLFRPEHVTDTSFAAVGGGSY